MIEIKNLTKTYKLNKKQMKESRTTNPIKTAVNDLTLTARKGEIYGLWDLMEQGRRLRCAVFPRSSGRQRVRSMWMDMRCAKSRRKCGKRSDF